MAEIAGGARTLHGWPRSSPPAARVQSVSRSAQWAVYLRAWWTKLSCGAVFSDRRGLWKPKLQPTAGRTEERQKDKPTPEDVSERLRLNDPTKLRFANRRQDPRRRRGSRGERRPVDQRLLEQAFPGLSRSPAGAIVRIADGLFDITEAAQEATREIHRAQVRNLVAQIQDVEADYQFESFGEPETVEGRANQINALRFKLAGTLYRARGQLGPLQFEVMRAMQETADKAYEEALERSERGLLRPLLSPREAIGNFVDRAVKLELRSILNFERIDYSAGRPVRVQGREYISSGDDRSYKRPDARVGNIAFDATIREKTLRDEQIRGFFSGDFRPDFVIIVRPQKEGGSYLITRP